MESERQANHYVVVRQGVDEVRRPDSAPAIAIGEYLVRTGQQDLFRKISIYDERGDRPEEIRRLYMNEVAVRIWREMGREPNVIGERYRPPKSALLAFGVPFTE